MVDANLHMTLIVSAIETDKLQMMHTGRKGGMTVSYIKRELSAMVRECHSEKACTGLARQDDA